MTRSHSRNGYIVVVVQVLTSRIRRRDSYDDPMLISGAIVPRRRVLDPQ